MKKQLLVMSMLLSGVTFSELFSAEVFPDVSQDQDIFKSGMVFFNKATDGKTISLQVRDGEKWSRVKSALYMKLLNDPNFEKGVEVIIKGQKVGDKDTVNLQKLENTNALHVVPAR